MKAKQEIVVWCLFVMICLSSQPIRAEWTQQAVLTGTNSFAPNEFGRSVSIDDEYAVVGSVVAYEEGRIPVYKLFGSLWVLQDELYPSGMMNWEYIEFVSIDGDYIVLGRPADYSNGSYSGSAYIFHKWYFEYWEEQQKLYSSDIAPEDHFGCAVAIDGDYAVIGAWGDDDKGADAGAVYVFKRSDATWIQQSKLLPCNGMPADQFGNSVAISGNTIIVGALEHTEVFTRTGETWSFQAILVNKNDFIRGHSVDIDGDYILVGDRHYCNGYCEGAAFVFQSIDSTWKLQKMITPPDENYGNFGHSVSLSGSLAAIGTNNNKALIYRRYGIGWVLEQTLPLSDSVETFGSSVSIDKNHVIVGAPEYSGGDVGAAFIYSTLCAQILEADSNGDCVVNIVDFSILANQWLLDGTQP